MILYLKGLPEVQSSSLKNITLSHLIISTSIDSFLLIFWGSLTHPHLCEGHNLDLKNSLVYLDPVLTRSIGGSLLCIL